MKVEASLEEGVACGRTVDVLADFSVYDLNCPDPVGVGYSKNSTL